MGKPLIEMTEKELKDTFRELGCLTNFEILQDARHNKGQEIIVAMAVLTLEDGTERRAYDQLEYGDEEGTKMVQNFIEEITETPGMLKPGEKLELRIQQVTAMVDV
jgi:hypothetical protein